MLPAGSTPAAPSLVGEAAHGGITDVERGLETAERTVSHGRATVSAVGDASRAAKTVGGARSVARASLAIGTKVWRVSRTIGKVLIHILLPVTPLDLVLNLAFVLWDLWNLKSDIDAQLKKNAFETVMKQKKAEIESEIRYKLLDNPNPQQRCMRQWDENPNFSGFLYARVAADLISDHGAPAFVQKVTVSDTSSKHETELTHTDYPEVKTVTSVLGYTIYPPVMTPFDIVLTKVTNLFVDTLYFIGTFSNAAPSYMQTFADGDGIHYKETYDKQYGEVEAFQFPSPLVAARCRDCLRYLHWAAARLAKHVLVAQDVEGNPENPEKGVRRRHRILVALLEGEGSGRYNFSQFAEKLNRLVEDGSATPEMNAAMIELYLGARDIWRDLLRIEKSLSKPEYLYYGPTFDPGR
jgi:hypothetical protein